jgi:hypothetical protein
MKIIMVLVVAVLMNSCMSFEGQKLTQGQIEWLNKVMKEDLYFSVPVDSGDIIWNRAYKFHSLYGDMKLQIANEYLLEEYNPIKGGCAKYSYSIYRLKNNDKYEIIIKGVSSNEFLYNYSWLNENLHILAYYLRTGKLEHPELVDKNCELSYHEFLRAQYTGKEEPSRREMMINKRKNRSD